MNFKNDIIRAIELLLSTRTAALPYDKTFPSVIYGVNTDGTYTIIKDMQKRCVKNALGTALPLGQNVWVKIPNGILENMHICGIR